jgi:hypothetical protein
MIRLKDLILENAENPERRINLMKITTIMEKLYPEFTDKQSKRLMELCAEAHMMASQLNTKPFIRTENTMVEWKLLVAAFQAKLNEIKMEVTKCAENKPTVNIMPVVRALDEMIAN